MLLRKETLYFKPHAPSTYHCFLFIFSLFPSRFQSVIITFICITISFPALLVSFPIHQWNNHVNASGIGVDRKLVMRPYWSVFLLCLYSFQASSHSPDRGHVLDFCIMMLIWGFGRLNPLTHARLNRMSPAPPVPLFQLPRLTECLYSLPTAVTNPSMPGVHGTRDAHASKLPRRLGRRTSEQQSAPLAPPQWRQASVTADLVPDLLLLTSLMCL